MCGKAQVEAGKTAVLMLTGKSESAAAKTAASAAETEAPAAEKTQSVKASDNRSILHGETKKEKKKFSLSTLIFFRNLEKY